MKIFIEPPENSALVLSIAIYGLQIILLVMVFALIAAAVAGVIGLINWLF